MSQTMIFFDIDGTLLDHDKQLPDSTKQAIHALKEKGYEVGIATGRAPFMFRDLAKELDIDTYVSFNGQYVVVKNKVVYKNPLHLESLRKLAEYSSKKQHPLVYLSHEEMKSNIEYHPHIQESIETLKFSHPPYDPEYFEDREIYQSLLFCTEGEEKDYMEKFEQFDFIRWHPVSTDVLPAGGSKARGIKAVISHLGVSEDRVYAFGDGLNDIEMLRFVKNSVAMGNAHESVKKVARHITKDVTEDGIAYGLELLGLL
ncbi:Cof-type HAD-IIB family hydrolase [Bacillus methanolicus]|uniref:Cof-type HAD-IIB family hydrolase n=1 Tax=Bacillus methanolicus TaxID=1471 RepID=UPI0023806B94|nr:Cof-type HAD-IIB family hydrolase [Bacillus methanolicus]MDE3838091.1 Cof-type HAD-IIB family hydrolase [Bacillus methanolicus]